MEASEALKGKERGLTAIPSLEQSQTRVQSDEISIIPLLPRPSPWRWLSGRPEKRPDIFAFQRHASYNMEL